MNAFTCTDEAHSKQARASTRGPGIRQVYSGYYCRIISVSPEYKVGINRKEYIANSKGRFTSVSTACVSGLADRFAAFLWLWRALALPASRLPPCNGSVRLPLRMRGGRWPPRPRRCSRWMRGCELQRRLELQSGVAYPSSLRWISDCERVRFW